MAFFCYFQIQKHTLSVLSTGILLNFHRFLKSLLFSMFFELFIFSLGIYFHKYPPLFHALGTKFAY